MMFNSFYIVIGIETGEQGRGEGSSGRGGGGDLGGRGRGLRV